MQTTTMLDPCHLPTKTFEQGELIEEALKKTKMFRAALAENCGIPPQWISQYCNGRRMPLNVWLNCWKLAGYESHIAGTIAWACATERVAIDLHGWKELPRDRTNDQRTKEARRAKKSGLETLEKALDGLP